MFLSRSVENRDLMKILISGLGVAGGVLAYWLHEFGFETVLIEKSYNLRTAGTVIEMYWDALGIFKKMGLGSVLSEKGQGPTGAIAFNRSGRKIGGFSAQSMSEASSGDYLRIFRNDLVNAIYAAVKGGTNIVFDNSITAIKQDSTGVEVSFDGMATQKFDLVIGCDGAHSKVRSLVFGEERNFERRLGMLAAVFVEKNYDHSNPEFDLAYIETGKFLQCYAAHGDQTAFLMSMVETGNSQNILNNRDEQRAALGNAFGGEGWECPKILKLFEKKEDVYFDRIIQIKMDRWAQGRVALCGDSAHCASLWAGEGAILASISAYVLANELRNCDGDYEKAFSNHYQLVHPLTTQRQKMGAFSAGLMLPRNMLAKVGLRLLLKMMANSLTIDRIWFQPNFTMPEYEHQNAPLLKRARP